jgi:predicted transcriptional regulator
MPDWKAINKIKGLNEEGKSYSEIALIMGMTRGQVAGFLHRYKDTEVIDLSDIHTLNRKERNKRFDDIIARLKEME